MCDTYHALESLYWKFRDKIHDSSEASIAFAQASLMVIKQRNAHVEGCGQCQLEESKVPA